MCYGLTPSNSFLFAWQNVCVNRSPTNRADTSIELFDSGETVTRFGDWEGRAPARPPEGFCGQGQDDGPYKMVVTAPGSYSFPLEVFNEYRACTCPTRVPLSFSYDDGYRIEEEMSFGMPPAQSNNLNNPNNRTMLLASSGVPDYYIVCMVPNVYIVPSHVPLSQAVGAHLGIYCNYPSGPWDCFSFSSSFLTAFSSRSDAEIEAAENVDRVIVMMSVAGHECSGVFYIDPPPNDDNPPHHQCCNACCGEAALCGCDIMISPQGGHKDGTEMMRSAFGRS